MLIAAGSLAAMLSAVDAREMTGPPLELTQPRGQDWVESVKPESFGTWVNLLQADGNSRLLTFNCIKGRGTVGLQEDAQPREPLQIDMVIQAGGQKILSEEAEFWVTGYVTRWVEPKPFLAAVRGLAGHTKFEMFMQGETRQTQFNIVLNNDRGFRRAAEMCAKLIME
jgi:hypothetical protein